jgi:hypothetical protein
MNKGNSMTQKDGFEVRIAYRNVIFKFLSAYRWARVSDLATMLWPDNPNSSARAHLLCRSLESQKILHRRTLPDDMGFVVLLTKQGADLASEVLGIPVSCWEKMGELSQTKSLKPPLWYPCKRIKHAALTRTAIATIYPKGVSEFRSEEEWKSQNKKSIGKIPDSTFTHNGNTFWVEVENAHKTGKNMEEVALAAVDVLSGQKQICNKFCLVAAKGSRHLEVFTKHFKNLWKKNYPGKIMYFELEIADGPRVKVLGSQLRKIEFPPVHILKEEKEWDELRFIQDAGYDFRWKLQKQEGMESTVLLRKVREEWIVNLVPSIDGYECEKYLNDIAPNQKELAMREAKKWAYEIIKEESDKADALMKKRVLKSLGL